MAGHTHNYLFSHTVVPVGTVLLVVVLLGVVVCVSVSGEGEDVEGEGPGEEGGWVAGEGEVD